jgi:thiamine pyrophosphokinase
MRNFKTDRIETDYRHYVDLVNERGRVSTLFAGGTGSKSDLKQVESVTRYSPGLWGGYPR